MQFTVKDALEDIAPFVGIGGTVFCPDDPDSVKSSLRNLNSVRRMIYSQGDQNYLGTVGWMAIKINEAGEVCSCFKDGAQTKMTLPIQVESVISAVSGDVDVRFVGRNHLMIPRDSAMRWGSVESPFTVLTLFESATKPPVAYRPSERFNFFLRSQSTDDKDTITLKVRRGINTTMQKIQLNGIEYVAGLEGVDEIIECSKPVTSGPVSVYLKDCKEKPGLEIARWPANMKNPRYLEVVATSADTYRRSCEDETCVLIYFRKKFIELTDLDELVDIESLDALQFGSKAKAYQTSDIDQYSKCMAMMKQHLQLVDFSFKISAASEEVRPIYENGHEISGYLAPKRW